MIFSFNPKLIFQNLIGTKESAYIHALTSAGIAYVITKACSTGRLSSCGCDMTMKDRNVNGSIRWTGCSDNVLFGMEIARKFVNLGEGKMKTRMSLLNLHNNQIGIRVNFSLKSTNKLRFLLDDSFIH
jgi:hypothetical protein